MLRKSLQYTRDVLSQHLRNKFGLKEEIVVVNRLVDGDGKAILGNQNKVILSMINLWQEKNQRFYQKNTPLQNGQFAKTQPAQRYNVDLLVTAHFDDYDESLKFLNAVLLFFQANPALSAKNFSDLPHGIEKLEFEMDTINSTEIHNLWTAVGARYQPSVVFKVRLLSVQAGQVEAFQSAVSAVQTTSRP